MTGRRSMQTYTERMSRAMQFVPGHVGGRVASAQPVQRRRTIGQAGSVSLVIYPVTIIESLFEPPTAPVTWTGAAGDNTLRDSSDATYMSTDFVLDSVGPPFDHGYGWTTATFEAKTLPITTITAISLTIRMRGTAGYRLAWDLAGNIEPSGGYSPYYAASKPAAVGPGWTDVVNRVTPATLAGSDDWYVIPSLAEIAAGDIQIIFTAWTEAASHTVDVAGMWLTVEGT